jgi:hypothetical protein
MKWSRWINKFGLEKLRRGQKRTFLSVVGVNPKSRSQSIKVVRLPIVTDIGILAALR